MSARVEPGERQASAVDDGAALDAALHGHATDPRSFLARFGYDPPPLDVVARSTPPVAASVHHGLWIWRCPCGIGGMSDPPSGGGVVFVSCLVGWCPRCRNADVDGGWRPLVLPSERSEIEAALSARRDRTTRNWSAGESIAELHAENAAHADEVD